MSTNLAARRVAANWCSKSLHVEHVELESSTPSTADAIEPTLSNKGVPAVGACKHELEPSRHRTTPVPPSDPALEANSEAPRISKVDPWCEPAPCVRARVCCSRATSCLSSDHQRSSACAES